MGTADKEKDLSLSVIYKYARGNFTDGDDFSFDAWWPFKADLSKHNNSLVVSPFWNVSAKMGELEFPRHH